MSKKSNLGNFPVIMVFAVAMFMPAFALPDNSTTISQTAHYIKIQPDVSLEIIDWGGQGTPVVFLAGLGHTAHVFDEFAPRFIDEYRVLGISRRGFGSSSIAESGYSIDTLANDILTVLDSLKLEDVVLVGHSLGGDEITSLATRRPSRLAAIIYIDAAYAQVTTRDSLSDYALPDIQTPAPTQEDLKSPESYQLYYERVNGVRMPITEILAMYNWNEDGSLAGGRTPGWIYSRISNSLHDQEYDGIDLPALAIYGVEYPIEELFLDHKKADSSSRELMMAYYHASKRLATMSRKRFRDQMQNGTVVEIYGAGHSLYITHSDRVEQEIRAFLKGIE